MTVGPSAESPMFATFCPARRDITEAPTLQAGWTRGQVNDNLIFMNAGLAVVLGTNHRRGRHPGHPAGDESQ